MRHSLLQDTGKPLPFTSKLSKHWLLLVRGWNQHSDNTAGQKRKASPCMSCLCALNARCQQSSLPITAHQPGMQHSHRLSPIANSCHRHHSHQLFTGALPPCLPLRLVTKAGVNGEVVRNTGVRSKSHCWLKCQESLDSCHVTPRPEQEMLLYYKVIGPHKIKHTSLCKSFYEQERGVAQKHVDLLTMTIANIGQQSDFNQVKTSVWSSRLNN